MAVKSIYIPEPSIENGRLQVAGDEHQHLRVGRVEEAELVEVFDGRGTAWTARVELCGRRETVVRILEERVVEAPAFELILGLSLVKAAAFEMAIEKCVEAGVTRIVPVIANRSNVSGARRLDRWLRVIVEAAKQSKRYHLPVVDEPMPFGAALNIPAVSRILFAERGGGALLPALSGAPVFFLVGPEGGWTDEEMESARQTGFAPVSLGDGILRTETAAVVGAALIRYELQRNP